MPKLFIFFIEACNMLHTWNCTQLQPQTTCIIHLKTVVKSTRFTIFVLIFHGNNPKVKVHKLNFEEVNV